MVYYNEINSILDEIRYKLNDDIDYFQRCPCGRCNNFEIVGRRGNRILLNEYSISKFIPNYYQIRTGERYRIPQGYGYTAGYQMEMMNQNNYTTSNYLSLSDLEYSKYSVDFAEEKPIKKLKKLALLYWSYFQKHKEKAF